MKLTSYSLVSLILLSYLFFSCGKEDELKTLEYPGEQEPLPYVSYIVEREDTTFKLYSEKISINTAYGEEFGNYYTTLDLSGFKNIDESSVNYGSVIDIISPEPAYQFFRTNIYYTFGGNNAFNYSMTFDNYYYILTSGYLWSCEDINFDSSYVLFNEINEDRIKGEFEIYYRENGDCPGDKVEGEFYVPNDKYYERL